MKEIKVPEKVKWTIYILSLLLAIAATYCMYPKKFNGEVKFKEGETWQYKSLVAPRDFAIDKSDSELQKDKDSALRTLEPFLVRKTKIENEQIKRFDKNTVMVLDKPTVEFARNTINSLYTNGVVSNELKDELEKMGVSKVKIYSNNIVYKKPSLENLLTVEEACEYVKNILGKEQSIDRKVFQSLKIESYIKANLEIDENKTEQAKQEIIDKLALTSGMIQKGEKIIDKGEIITPEKYKVLLSYDKLSSKDKVNYNQINIWKEISSILLIAILYTLLFVYFILFRNDLFQSVRVMFFMLLMVLGMITILWLVIDNFGNFEYIVPFAILPLVIRVFFDSNTAIYVHTITVLMTAQMVSQPMLFVFLQLIAGIVAVTSLKDMNSRSQMLKSILLIFTSYLVVFVLFELSNGVSFTDIEWMRIISFAINAIALLFVYGLIFVIEKVFGFLSEVTLVELSNINNPLLMKFSEKCPGTFQHVLQVSNLSVEVAKEINANALLVRTGALYHDLGKMDNPMYFTENQAGKNPLNDLSYEDAAQIIISHVSSGVRIANKERLPSQIVDFIKMHHGMSKTKYFYNSFKNKYPDKEIDESMFTYPGPLPSTKETAILMMSDAVEAASRSLQSYTDESIDGLVENIVNGQIADGQLKNSPISFKDVEIAKKVFKVKLKNIYHTRIKYPELKNNTQKQFDKVANNIAVLPEEKSDKE